MDSLMQNVLRASLGDFVLGKKVGNGVWYMSCGVF